MSLRNTQYDTIIREYNRRQIHNRHVQDERLTEVLTAIPGLEELNREVASTSVAEARQLLAGDGKALERAKMRLSQLSDKRNMLLAKHGFPLDYLDPVYTCTDCKDSGYIGNEKCHCFKQAVIDLLYTQSNIREILEVENFRNFSYDYYSNQQINPSTGLTSYATMKKTVAECKQFINQFDSEFQNIFFYGDTGVGKTYLSHCIAKELIESAHSVIYFSAFELFDLMAKNTFGKEEDIQSMHPYLFECDLLIIDDLGTELTNSFVSSQLFLCINERLSRRKSTIISTNLPMNIFADTYSERVFSRITSNYTMTKLFGDDIRIQKKLSGIKP